MSRVALLATDLDGTLLDSETYDFSPARPALEALHAAGVPLVLASAKTAAEMAAIAPALGATAVVVENGGAVLARFPDGLAPPPPWQLVGGGWRLVLGPSRGALLAALPEVARDAGASVRPFAWMSVEDVAALTGLPRRDAERAMRREHDEPFLVEGLPGRDEATDARLDEAARARGLRVTHGGRLHHLTGPTDKADALRALVATWPGGLGDGTVVALGDAANDLPLLRAADRPIVMPRADGSIDPALAAHVRGSERAPLPGPAGWGAAVLAVLRGERLRRVDP